MCERFLGRLKDVTLVHKLKDIRPVQALVLGHLLDHFRDCGGLWECALEQSLRRRKGDPVKAELDTAMKRIGELTMQVELLEAKRETSGPLGRRRSRR